MKPHAHPHKRQEMSALTSRLRGQSHKITGPRAAILEILRHHRHPLTTREIHSEMPGGSCDLATIYRAMHMLEKMGMVKRFDFGDGAARFELVGENDDGHHHHLVCTQCLEVVEIERPKWWHGGTTWWIELKKPKVESIAVVDVKIHEPEEGQKEVTKEVTKEVPKKGWW